MRLLLSSLVPSCCGACGFVDDNTSFFRDVVQYGRLMPEFVASLRSSGLELKVQKTCTLGLVAPSRSPTLPDFAHVTEAKFVGVALL